MKVGGVLWFMQYMFYNWNMKAMLKDEEYKYMSGYMHEKGKIWQRFNKGNGACP